MDDVNTPCALAHGADIATRVHTRPCCCNILMWLTDLYQPGLRMHILLENVSLQQRERAVERVLWRHGKELSFTSIATSPSYSAIVRCIQNITECVSYCHLYSNEYKVDFKRHGRGLRCSTLLFLGVAQSEKCHS